MKRSDVGDGWMQKKANQATIRVSIIANEMKRRTLGIHNKARNNMLCHLQKCKEWKRTHLRKCARGCIYGTPEGRQGEEGALEDKVDERVKRLKVSGFSVLKIARALAL